MTSGSGPRWPRGDGPPPRARGGWSLPVLAFLLLATVRAGVVEERDPYWQVRAGLENLSGAPLRRPDTWSWDPVPGLFTQTSPAWNDVLALGWRASAFWGVFAVAFASIAAFLGVSALLARRMGATPIGAVVGIGVVAMACLPMLSPRAALVAQTVFLLSVLGADSLLARSPRLPVLAVALLGGGAVVAWAGMWVHLSWLLLAPALWLALVAMLVVSPGTTPGSIATGAGSALLGLVLGVLAGPYGTEAWSLSREVQRACEGVITEWLPVYTPGLWQRWIAAEALALGISLPAVVGVVARWRRSGPSASLRLPLALLVLALPAAVGGIVAIRFIGVSLLALAPLAAVGATALARVLAARADEDPPRGLLRNARVRHWARGEPWRVVWWAVLVLVAPVAVISGANVARPTPELAAVSALPRGCLLLSDPGSAAPVILLRPDVRVWTDGRADYWGRERNVAAAAVLSGGPEATAVLDRATCVVLTTSGLLDTGGLAVQLDGSRSWREIDVVGSTRVWVSRR